MLCRVAVMCWCCWCWCSVESIGILGGGGGSISSFFEGGSGWEFFKGGRVLEKASPWEFSY